MKAIVLLLVIALCADICLSKAGKKCLSKILFIRYIFNLIFVRISF